MLNSEIKLGEIVFVMGVSGLGKLILLVVIVGYLMLFFLKIGCIYFNDNCIDEFVFYECKIGLMF